MEYSNKLYLSYQATLVVLPNLVAYIYWANWRKCCSCAMSVGIGVTSFVDLAGRVSGFVITVVDGIDIMVDGMVTMVDGNGILTVGGPGIVSR